MSDKKSLSIQVEEILMKQKTTYPCLYDKTKMSYKEGDVNRNAEKLDFIQNKYKYRQEKPRGDNPLRTRHCGNIVFLLDLHRIIDGIRIEIKVTSLYDIFFQHHNGVVAIK